MCRPGCENYLAISNAQPTNCLRLKAELSDGMSREDMFRLTRRLIAIRPY